MEKDPTSASRRKYAVLLPTNNRFFEWLVTILLLAGPLSSIFFGGSRITSAYPFLIASHIGLFLFCFKPFINKAYRRLVLPPGALLAFALLVYSVVHWLLFSDVPRESRYEVYKLVSYFGAFLVWAELSAHRTRWATLLALLMLGMTVVGWLGLIGHLDHLRDPEGAYLVLGVERAVQYNDRVSGSFLCPNHFAHIAAMMLILSAGILFTKNSGTILKLIAFYSIPLMGFGLVFSQSRSGVAGFLAGFGVTMLLIGLKQSVWKFAFALIMLLALAGGVGSYVWYGHPSFKARILETLEDDVRWRIWPDTVKMIEADPVMGTGPGTYRHTFPTFREAYDDAELTLRYAHNEYLHMFAEYGLIGLALVGALLLWVLARLLQGLWKAEKPRDIGLVAILLGVLVGSLVHSVFDFQFQLFANPHVFIMIFGVIFGRLFVSQLYAPFRVKKWFLFPAVILCMGILGITAVWATQDFHTSLTLKKIETYEEQLARVDNEVFVKGAGDPGRVLRHFARLYNTEVNMRGKLSGLSMIKEKDFVGAGELEGQFQLVADRFARLPPLSPSDKEKRPPIPPNVEPPERQVLEFTKAYKSLLGRGYITPDGQPVSPDPREKMLTHVRLFNGSDWRGALRSGWLSLEQADRSILDRERQAALADEARDYFQKAFKLNPYEDEALQGLAWAEHRKGNLDQAIAYMEQALSLEQFHVDYLVQYGQFLGEANRWQEAMKPFETASRLNSERRASMDRHLVQQRINANIARARNGGRAAPAPRPNQPRPPSEPAEPVDPVEPVERLEGGNTPPAPEGAQPPGRPLSRP